MLFTAALIVILACLIYKFWISNYNYWEEKGVQFIPGKFPFGSDYNFTLLRKFQGYVLQEVRVIN